MEELIAELSAAFTCARLGYPNEPRRDHAPYIANWLDAMQGDTRAIFTAATKAQEACDFLFSEVTSYQAEGSEIEEPTA